MSFFLHFHIVSRGLSNQLTNPSRSYRYVLPMLFVSFTEKQFYFHLNYSTHQGHNCQQYRLKFLSSWSLHAITNQQHMPHMTGILALGNSSKYVTLLFDSPTERPSFSKFILKKESNVDANVFIKSMLREVYKKGKSDTA